MAALHASKVISSLEQCDSKSTNAFPGRRAVRVIVVLDPAKVSGVGFKIKQHFHAFFSVSKIKTRWILKRRTKSMEDRFLENNAPFLWNHWCYVSGRNGKIFSKYSDQITSKHASSNLFNVFSTRNFQASIRQTIHGRQVEFRSKSDHKLCLNALFADHLSWFEAVISHTMM